MISPEEYYEIYLKGKTHQQIISTIRGLKNEIGRLKHIMEHPDYSKEVIMMPSEATRLRCTRLYLKKAKEALIETGGTYTPSHLELKAQDFEENIPYITKIIFSIGCFHGGYETYTIDLTGEQLRMDLEHSLIFKPTNFFIEPDYPMSKEKFLSKLCELHLGEWRRGYTTQRFGYDVLDGTQWDLKIYFYNKHKPFKVYGDNAYPYNFNNFQKLFGINGNECENE